VLQQVELPEIPVRKEEHTSYAQRCARCARTFVAPFADELRKAGLIGPRVTALVGFLKGACHMSFSTIRKFFRDVIGVRISRGMLRKLVGKVSASLEDPYEALCAIKPDIIMLSMSGYGQQGPYMDWGAYGMGLEPASGISRLTGYRDGGPLRSGLSFTDPLSGFVAAGAVLAALHYRRRTGKGQYIDLSEQEAAIPLIGAHIMEYVMTGRLPRRMGNRSEYAAPQGCYPCRGEDSWIVISVESDDEWSALCRATGHADWEDDERFADVLSRHRHHDEIDRLLSEWTSQHNHLEAMRLLQAAGVKAAAVLDGKEILFDPHFRARHHFDLVDQPLLGKRWVQRHVIAKFSDFEAETRSHAPLLGEHNRDVLIGELGLSEEEYQALEDGHVLGTEPDMVVPPQVLSAALKLPYDKYVEHGIIRTIDPDYQQQLGLE
jgi:crotonobetainyl-CoA:carnitine CoA-transferase CaiB-like acyl-CoA transferase